MTECYLHSALIWCTLNFKRYAVRSNTYLRRGHWIYIVCVDYYRGQRSVRNKILVCFEIYIIHYVRELYYMIYLMFVLPRMFKNYQYNH